jgi:hypothetical protein
MTQKVTLVLKRPIDLLYRFTLASVFEKTIATLVATRHDSVLLVMNAV